MEAEFQFWSREQGTKTLRALGFTGPIEKVNRGWDRPRLIAYLHSEYCSRPTPDVSPSGDSTDGLGSDWRQDSVID